MNFNKKNAYWFLLSALIVLTDQLSKHIANTHLMLHESFHVVSFFNIMLNYNPGVAFSWLSNVHGWQVYLLALVSLVISILLSIWLLRLPCSQKLLGVGLSLVIGGALGNFIDRITLGYVIDFFDFHIADWHYATFNIADSAVCIGVALMIFQSLRGKNLD